MCNQAVVDWRQSVCFLRSVIPISVDRISVQYGVSIVRRGETPLLLFKTAERRVPSGVMTCGQTIAMNISLMYGNFCMQWVDSINYPHCFGAAITSDVMSQLFSWKRGGAQDPKKPAPYYLVVKCSMTLFQIVCNSFHFQVSLAWSFTAVCLTQTFWGCDSSSVKTSKMIATSDMHHATSDNRQATSDIMYNQNRNYQKFDKPVALPMVNKTNLFLDFLLNYISF